VQAIFVYEHVCAAALSCDVTVAVVTHTGKRKDDRIDLQREIYNGIPTVRFSCPVRGVPKLRYLPRLYREVEFLRGMIEETAPDVIHAINYTSAVVSAVACRKSGIPVVTSEHYSGFYTNRVQGLEQLKARWGLARSAVTLPVSRYLLERIEAHGIRSNSEVVPNTIDVKTFRPPEQYVTNSIPRGIAVGLLAPIKGFDYLIDAIALLKKEGQTVKIDLVGYGVERERLEGKVRNLGLAEQVILRGALPKPEIAGLMRRSDFMVSSSLGETFGVAIIEGMACGLPVVAARAGAVPELVDERNGILVEPANALALSEGITNILSGNKAFDRNLISERVRAKYCHESVGKQLLDVYTKVMDRKKGK
jgi:glycosyltransferase involved in cell wall biosynthesis